MLDRWARQFPSCEPVAYELRERFSDGWVRFHSLPESKRYPETDAEYAILLDRHNAVLQTLAAPSSPLILLTTEVTRSPQPPATSTQGAGAIWWRAVAKEPNHYWHVFATECQWRPCIFDSVVREVAQDVRANVMICDVECRWIVHPYDGGMDVILESSHRRDQLRERFKTWLSSHPLGL